MNTRASGSEGVTLQNLSKCYHGHAVVKEFNLEVRRGEIGRAHV